MPEGFGKENIKKCFCRILLVFYVEGEMTWITVNVLTTTISVCLRITEMRRKVFVSGVLRGNGNGNAISPKFYRTNDKMMMSVSNSKFNHFFV